MRPLMVYNYVEVIESYGIKYDNIDIHQLDLDQYDDNLILAMITAIIRSDRINEGLIIDMIENGAFLKLLLRLKDFDKPLLKEDIITKIRYSFSCFGDYTKNEGFVIDISEKERVRIVKTYFNVISTHQDFLDTTKDASRGFRVSVKRSEIRVVIFHNCSPFYF